MATSVIVDPQGMAVQSNSDILSNAERERLISELTKPFRIAEIRWRIMEKSPDKKSALMVPFVTRAVMMNRLNSVLGIGKWEKCYPRQETRVVNCPDGTGFGTKRSRTSITIRLTLPGIGFTEENGEAWADDQNATTSADSQSFKRACKHFGIGAYLDGLGTTVPLDNKGEPEFVPTIPSQFLCDEDKAPANKGEASGSSQTPQPQPKGPPPRGGGANLPRPASRTPERMALEQKAQEYKETLGQSLYFSIVQPLKRSRRPGDSDELVIKRIVAALDSAVAALDRANLLSAGLSLHTTEKILKTVGIDGLQSVPSLEVLEKLLRALALARGRARSRCRALPSTRTGDREFRFARDPVQLTLFKEVRRGNHDDNVRELHAVFNQRHDGQHSPDRLPDVDHHRGS